MPAHTTEEHKHGLRTCHLFAGIGGGLLADLILGHRPIVAVEWEPYACQVIRERAREGWFPDLRVWEGDVRMFDPSEYAGKVDCIHAGFPCQDISVAGKQAGVSEGTRSGLYREVLRIAGIVRPRYMFLENVAAILSNGLGTVLGDLASMGYDTRWCCIRASDVGAPHHRDRWFLLADSKGFRRIRMDKSRTERCATVNSEKSCEVWGRTGYLPFHVDGFFTNPDSGKIRNDDGLSIGVCALKGIGNSISPMQGAVAWKLLGGE